MKVKPRKKIEVFFCLKIRDKFPNNILLESIENTNRAFYGGAIGFMDFEGNFNQAIMIWIFLSKNHQLHYQAGAGIVESSTEENEMQEIYNKLRALNNALELAETLTLHHHENSRY
jgi:anthranilate/para-aminobenzoate synthase component I